MLLLIKENKKIPKKIIYNLDEYFIIKKKII